MKNKVCVAAVICLALSPCPSVAREDASLDNCKSHLKEMKRDLDAIATLVPNVPPDEEAYLAKEYADASRANSGARLFAVEKRPYYTAWQFHDAVANALNQIDINNGVDPQQNLKLAGQMASRIPIKISELREEWNDFAAHTDNRELTLEQVGEGAKLSYKLSDALGHYIWCLGSFNPENK
jgi:hypothetical protein